MKCVYCDVEMALSKEPNGRAGYTRWRCPYCSWKCDEYRAPDAGPPTKPPAAPPPAEVVWWLLDRLPADPEIQRRASNATVLYAIFTIQAVSTARTRTEMTAALDFHLTTLVGQLRQLLDDNTEGGAK